MIKDKIELEKGKWFGANAHKTSLSYFGYSHGGSDFHVEEFEAVMSALLKLENRKQVELSYIRINHPKRAVIAYRFVSDRAYNKNYCKIQEKGQSLGRGVWNPFGDESTFNEFVSDETL